ncbi:UNVERIFIED_CONTAM: Troponin I [Trichonephila clavipes]
MTPARKKKLRTLLRKKAAEELKKEQERKAEERRKTINERCGPPKNMDGINEDQRIEHASQRLERQIHQTTTQKSLQIRIRKKLMRAAKKADHSFRANLKSVGPSTKFKLDEDVKETKPDWALGAKKGDNPEE